MTVMPDPPYQRFIELFQLAERLGLRLRVDVRLARALAGVDADARARGRRRPSRIKLGHMVTNPGTREPTVLASAYATLQDISDGRMVMGIGRGDSARRYIGQQPVPVGRFEEALRMIKPFMNGEQGAAGTTRSIELGWVRPRAAGDRDARRRLRAQGARRRRARRRRRRHPARRPGHHPVDHGDGARGGRGGGPRPGGAEVHRLRRRATSPTTSPRRASRCAGSRRWSPTTCAT